MTARGLWHRFVGALTGTLFVSHKGRVYRLLGVAHEQTNARKPVEKAYTLRRIEDGLVAVYVSVVDGEMYTRDLKEWNGRTKCGCRRFVPTSIWG